MNTTQRQLEQAKLSAVKWQEEGRQAYIDGDMLKHALCHEFMAACLTFIEVLVWADECPSEDYTRFGNTPDRMTHIAPHVAVNRAYYDRPQLTKAKSPRSDADDNSELPASNAGRGGV